MTYAVRCGGRVATVRADPIAVVRGRFASGTLRGRVNARAASGTLVSCGHSRVTWHAKP